MRPLGAIWTLGSEGSCVTAFREQRPRRDRKNHEIKEWFTLCSPHHVTPGRPGNTLLTRPQRSTTSPTTRMPHLTRGLAAWTAFGGSPREEELTAHLWDPLSDSAGLIAKTPRFNCFEFLRKTALGAGEMVGSCAGNSIGKHGLY